MKRKPTCVVCKERPAISASIPKCERCLYEEEMKAQKEDLGT